MNSNISVQFLDVNEEEKQQNERLGEPHNDNNQTLDDAEEKLISVLLES